MLCRARRCCSLRRQDRLVCDVGHTHETITHVSWIASHSGQLCCVCTHETTADEYAIALEHLMFHLLVLDDRIVGEKIRRWLCLIQTPSWIFLLLKLLLFLFHEKSGALDIGVSKVDLFR